MALKDCHVMRVDEMVLSETIDRKQRSRLDVTYVDLDGNCLREFFYLSAKGQQHVFQMQFMRMHDRVVGTRPTVRSVAEVIAQATRFRHPKLVVAYKKRGFWAIREKIFSCLLVFGERLVSGAYGLLASDQRCERCFDNHKPVGKGNIVEISKIQGSVCLVFGPRV
jgi:hypothetical protein